ncbi:alpha-glucuronidase [Anaerosporobacter faecicola]|uniref:alpha-glucuronidase n=1 Tax=Anaerosporobacter faecicola TaxID=2718714 RepID=UPI00143976C7|nr:alpha-glucuronidase [Anaerosporobacter faecicola]
MSEFEYAWLAYKRIEQFENQIYFTKIHGETIDLVTMTAKKELIIATKEILGLALEAVGKEQQKKQQEEQQEKQKEKQQAEEQKDNKGIYFVLNKNQVKGSYHIWTSDAALYLEAAEGTGFLYGVFEIIRRLQQALPLKNWEVTKKPDIPYRMLNHWDNLDGSIERGYAGDSFFFQDNQIVRNERTRMYARLLASVGINATVINNVNVKDAATRLITDTYLKSLSDVAEIFREYGIALYLSLNFAAPMELGELTLADPCEEKVCNWWKDKMREVYAYIPDLGGFLVKADSEGRPGPFTYGRTHAEGANMLANAVAPYGGTIIWRCFVYNCMQDWRDKKTDRARSGYDHFQPLDGQFAENVILQIKNGPMDFQVREPISPLFGALHKTNQMLEVQIAQEYTGQQKHICYLLPMFEQILQFHTYCGQTKDTIRDLIGDNAYGQTRCGIAAVANTGNDSNWTGHDLAAANLYGFGRMAFDKEVSAEDILKEWIVMTYGGKKEVRSTLTDILMKSWQVYESYTAPLGIGWMVNPRDHYGPNVDGYEYDRWGTYHRADHIGIGVDRSNLGTGYALLYKEPLASLYNTIDTCPDELLLFFHHVPYTHVLHSGKTVIQHIYDTHFQGVDEVEKMINDFQRVKQELPNLVSQRIEERMEEQLRSAKEWRDQINTYFYRKSGIEDERNRRIY